MSSLKRTLTITDGNGASKRRRTGKSSRVSSTAKLYRMLTRSEETKYNDEAATNIVMNNAGAVSNLSDIIEGTGYNNRIGRKIRYKYIQYDLRVLWQNIATIAEAFTWHIVLDRQPNNGTPSYTTVMDVTTGPATNAFKAVNKNDQRFKILKTIVGWAGVSGQSESSVARGFIDCSRWDVRDQVAVYQDTTASSPNSNSILIMYSSDDPTGTHIFGQWRLRVAYTDA